MQLRLEVVTQRAFSTKVHTNNRQAPRIAIQFGLKTTTRKFMQTLTIMMITPFYHFSIEQKSHMKINCIIFIFKHYTNNKTDYRNLCHLNLVKMLNQLRTLHEI